MFGTWKCVCWLPCGLQCSYTRRIQMEIATVAKIQLSKNQSLSKERTGEVSPFHLIFISFGLRTNKEKKEEKNRKGVCGYVHTAIHSQGVEESDG